MSETIKAGDLDFHLENREQGEGRDGGPTMRVTSHIGSRNVELLRIDMFRMKPHYHYDPGPEGKNLRYDLDPLLIDDGIDWAVSFVSKKLPQMLEKAGYPQLATSANIEAAAKVMPEVEKTWRAQGAKEPAAHY
jgi:hypothetical protein